MVVAAYCSGDVFHHRRLGKWSKFREGWMVPNTGKIPVKPFVVF